jgi:hypothetical protein
MPPSNTPETAVQQSRAQSGRSDPAPRQAAASVQNPRNGSPARMPPGTVTTPVTERPQTASIMTIQPRRVRVAQRGPRTQSTPFPDDVRCFVESAAWRFAKTYAATWPHEYVLRTEENAPLILELAQHIFEHGVEGRFYSQVRKYHHEGGKVYWSMAETPEGATLINRCDEDQTYDARRAAGTLPKR